MIDKIPLIPDVPNELRIAAKAGDLVLFIGAGVSQLAGCPGWGDFADKALSLLAAKGKLSHAILDQIRGRNLNPRIKLALALDYAESAEMGREFLEPILHPTGWNKHEIGNRIYSALNAFGRAFVTTNYDYWLDGPLVPSTSPITETSISTSASPPPERRVIFRPEDFLISALGQSEDKVVIHLHGSLRVPSTMIMTTRDYIERYAYSRGRDGTQGADSSLPGRIDPAQDTTTLAFLEDLFRLKNVLFIGYGLDELEILEYIILKAKKQAAGERASRHFILQPFFSHETDLANGIDAYFKNQCGVNLIPFARDAKDYGQLVDVLEHFAKEIAVGPLLSLERRRVMDELLNE